MTSGHSLNYRLYCSARGLRERLLRRVPADRVAPRRDLSTALTIAVTTFSGRYASLFLPLYRQISRLFPEVPVVIAVNGGPDPAAQATYLERFGAEVCAGAPSHHQFLLHDQPVGLTRLWNGILAASPTATTLILNDDLQLDPWLRRWIEAIDWPAQRILFLNGSWSHFAINRALVERVGAFEPAFPGIGFEDMDYDARLHFAGESTLNLRCPWVHHLDHKPESTSFDGFSGRSWGKYTSANEAVFFERWRICDDPNGAWIHQLQARVQPVGSRAPMPLPPLPDGLRQGNRFYPQRPCADPPPRR